MELKALQRRATKVKEGMEQLLYERLNRLCLSSERRGLKGNMVNFCKLMKYKLNLKLLLTKSRSPCSRRSLTEASKRSVHN